MNNTQQEAQRLRKEFGDVQVDEHGRFYRYIVGDKIYQIEELSEHDIQMNFIINKSRYELQKLAK